MQNAELEIVQLDNSDIITTSGRPLTFTFKGFFDEVSYDGTITNDRTGEIWRNGFDDDMERSNSAAGWLNAALGIGTIDEATEFIVTGETLNLDEILAKDDYSQPENLIFNTTYK